MSQFDEYLFRDDREAVYSRPSSPDHLYHDAARGATLFIVSPDDLTNYRSVINTFHIKPLLLCEISSSTPDSALVDADGVIFKDLSRLNESDFGGIKIIQTDNSSESSPDFITLESFESNLIFSNGPKRITYSLISDQSESLRDEKPPPIVKICGLKTVEAAKEAISSGANMLGMIMVPGRSRTVAPEVASQISRLVKEARNSKATKNTDVTSYKYPVNGASIYDSNSWAIRGPNSGPFLVGVFLNQPLEDVLALQKQYDLDYVQFHGNEPIEWSNQIPVPVIKRFTPGTPEFQQCLIPGFHALALIDSPLGGEGKLVDRTVLNSYAKKGARFIIAGGLTPENVDSVYSTDGVIGVDVSGGVESNGEKDFSKIRKFVENAKSGWT